MNLEKKMEDESDILNDIKDLAKQISQLNEEAYHVYKPLVDDICNRRAPKMEVERLLDRLFGFGFWSYTNRCVVATGKYILTQ